MTPAARIERLARLGYVFDTSIFGRPSYRLTPKVPYQAVPEAWLLAYALDYYDPFHDVVAWSPPAITTPTSMTAGTFISGLRWPRTSGPSSAWRYGERLARHDGQRPPVLGFGRG